MITLLLFLLAEPNVDSLITQLGDDNYAARESASSQLLALADQMPPKAILPRLREARRHADFEIRWRSEQVIQKHYLKFTNEIKQQQWPWIDSLPKDYPDRAKLLKPIYSQFQDDIGQFFIIENIATVDEQLRQETYRLVLTLLEQDTDKQEIRGLIETMNRNEKHLALLGQELIDNVVQPRRWLIRWVTGDGFYHSEYTLKPLNPDEFPKR